MTTSDLLRLAAAAALASVVYATVWVVWVPWALLGRDHLAAKSFDAPPLTGAVATVA